MKILPAIFSLSLLYSAQSMAFFCPSNFNQINIGDTIQQVEAQCGKPPSVKTYKSEANVPQEWTYYVPIATDIYTQTAPGTNQGTMKVTFAFVNGKVVNMTSNGIGVGATAVCNAVNLQLGNSLKDVEKACGSPAVVTKTEIKGDQPAPTEVAEWKYEGANSATLIFEDGILKERK